MYTLPSNHANKSCLYIFLFGPTAFDILYCNIIIIMYTCMCVHRHNNKGDICLSFIHHNCGFIDVFASTLVLYIISGLNLPSSHKQLLHVPKKPKEGCWRRAVPVFSNYTEIKCKYFV